MSNIEPIESGTLVHNITGSSSVKKPDNYNSWIDMYRYETKHPRKKLKCSVKSCLKYGKPGNDLMGAHIRFGKKRFQYIIPFCKLHNSQKFSYNYYKDGLRVNQTEAIRAIKETKKQSKNITPEESSCFIL